MMHGPAVALISALTLVAATTVTAIAVANDAPDESSRRHMVGMMSAGPPGPTSDGWRNRHDDPDGWRHGASVRDEFDYLSEMVAHHQEAVQAAEQLQRSSRPEMRAFGSSVVKTQSAQIQQMEGWLAEWYPNRSPEATDRPMMRDLSALSGDRLDRAFLRDMVPHHMAAVMMSQQLIVRELGEHEQVTGLAEEIRAEQRAEIFQMTRWLRTWFDGTWGCADGYGMGPHMGGMGLGPGSRMMG